MIVLGPVRTYLDTNIIWYADWLGPAISDGDSCVLNSDPFLKSPKWLRAEWIALMDLFRWAQQGEHPDWVTSRAVLSELSYKHLGYGSEFLNWCLQQHLDDDFEAPIPATMLSATSNALNFLPDVPDRHLLAEASWRNCNLFLTLDVRTIWNYRERISKLLRIRTVQPSEMLSLYFGVTHEKVMKQLYSLV